MKKFDVHGYCDPAFEKAKLAFIDNFKRKKETGAAFALYLEGKTVVDIWAGYTDFRKKRPWQENSLANIYSATKGVTTLCALRLVDKGLLDLDDPVMKYWPEFGQAGKESITVRMLLNHTSGMVGIKSRLPGKALYDWDMMTTALAEHVPWWTPGEKHGYQAVTFGWLVGQIIRNITGMKVGEYLKQEVTGPLGLDIHIGLDPAEHHRSVTMIMLRFPSLNADSARFTRELITNPRGATASAFTNPISIATGVNSRKWRNAEIPAANGQATARSLAKLYSVLANGGRDNGTEILSPAMIEQCSKEEVCGWDAVLDMSTRFGPGFMLNQDTKSGDFGPGELSFGHPGAGGCLGFADPDSKMGFGYVLNKMDTYRLVDPRAKRLVDAVYQCL